MLNAIIYAECPYAEHCYAAHCYAEHCYAECRYAQCRYAECRYPECRCAKKVVATKKKVLCQIFFPLQKFNSTIQFRM